MANNYLEFSEVLELTDEQMDWAKVRMAEIEAGEEKLIDDGEETLLGFGYEFEDGGIWLYGEEYGNVENVAGFAYEIFNHFDIEGSFRIEWACHCSKPRLSEFYGGAVIVTKDRVIYINASEIAHKIEKAIIDGVLTSKAVEFTNCGVPIV